MDLLHKIQNWLHDFLHQAENESYFLVELKQNARHFEIFMDTDEGISLQQCVHLSRSLSKFLDEDESITEPFTLDFSSPGVGVPLVHKRQYKKNTGRTLLILFQNGKEQEGVLTECKDSGIIISYEEKQVSPQNEKKKIKVQVLKEIDFSEIKTATVKISFS